MQRKNCYIFGSCLRRYSKGYKPKTPLILNEETAAIARLALG